MDPRTWPGSRVLLVSLIWIPLVGYLTFRGSGAVMTASGPSDGLVGISSGALLHTALLAFGPPLLLGADWVASRSRPEPPVPKESATGGQRSKRQSRYFGPSSNPGFSYSGFFGARMTRVAVLGTVHEEHGLANIAALHAILEHLRPDVIFLEIPPAAFPAYSDGSRSNLESTAATRYRDTHSVTLVPVDSPTPEDSFFRDWQYMDRRITATSPTYRRLVDQNTHNIATYGFPYLSSERSSELWSEIYEAMEVALRRLSHDTRLPEIYENWRRTNELRDRAMLKSIADHFHLTQFQNGVLLVGAAHTQSIISISREERAVDTPRIELGYPHGPF